MRGRVSVKLQQALRPLPRKQTTQKPTNVAHGWCHRPLIIAFTAAAAARRRSGTQAFCRLGGARSLPAVAETHACDPGMRPPLSSHKGEALGRSQRFSTTNTVRMAEMAAKDPKTKFLVWLPVVFALDLSMRPITWSLPSMSARGILTTRTTLSLLIRREPTHMDGFARAR